jgi:hypothetical protein
MRVSTADAGSRHDATGPSEQQPISGVLSRERRIGLPIVVSAFSIGTILSKHLDEASVVCCHNDVAVVVGGARNKGG